MTAFDGIVAAEARSRGIAVEDAERSTAKFISHCYDDMPSGSGVALPEFDRRSAHLAFAKGHPA